MINIIITTLCLILLMFCVNSQAHAEDLTEDGLCDYLIPHTPDEDVMYKPGVDVEGNPVEPAEIQNTYSFQAPETVTFPLTVKLTEFLEDSDISDKLEMETMLKNITVNTKTGRVTVDGKEITEQMQSYCHKAHHPIKSGKEPEIIGPRPPEQKPER